MLESRSQKFVWGKILTEFCVDRAVRGRAYTPKSPNKKKVLCQIIQSTKKKLYICDHCCCLRQYVIIT